MALQPGEIIDGKYRIIRELGNGSMGAVYEGENVRIHRRVAIKVLLPGVAKRGDVVKRFEREAQAAGRIGSEHIVEVLDLGTLSDGGFYMVMEFLEGQTLGDRIRGTGRITPRQLVPVMQQLLFGLEMAHEARIVHRDLKPDNVFLVREYSGQKDFVKILDFGISKFNPLTDEEGVMSMTRTGTVMGTPFYMAPEQAKGAKDVDHRSDLYSVGVILYEAVTGQVPFHAGTFNELIFKIVLEAPPPPEHFVPDLDPAFSRLIRRSMAREAEERFQSASEFRDALSVWLHTGREGDDITPPPADLDWDDGLQTRLMDPPEMATQMVDPPDMATQMMEPGRPREGTIPLPAVPGEGLPTQLKNPLPAPAPPSRPAPPRPPPKKREEDRLQRISQPLSPHAPTPLPSHPRPNAMGTGSGTPPPPSVGFAEEPVMSVAGVPRKKSPLPVVIGAAAFLAIGSIIAVAFLIPDEGSSVAAPKPAAVASDTGGDEDDEIEAADEAEDEAVVDLDGSGDEEDGEESGDEASADDEGEEAETPAPSPEPPPAPRAAPPPVAAQPPPRTATPSPPPSPPPPTSPPKPSGKGRTIKTEL